jgi:ribonuclease P/MRP protein subunit RPP40
LFLTYINDIDSAVSSLIKKFADDTKLYRTIACQDDAVRLQTDLHNLLDWSADWQMLFNARKCKVIHLGYSNEKHNYYMGDVILEETILEKNLGVLIHNSFKPSAHCAAAVKKANSILGMIKRSFIYIYYTCIIQTPCSTITGILHSGLKSTSDQGY